MFLRSAVTIIVSPRRYSGRLEIESEYEPAALLGSGASVVGAVWAATQAVAVRIKR
jgi:hypothetical protein